MTLVKTVLSPFKDYSQDAQDKNMHSSASPFERTAPTDQKKVNMSYLGIVSKVLSSIVGISSGFMFATGECYRKIQQEESTSRQFFSSSSPSIIVTGR